jgi:hypothetical protein
MSIIHQLYATHCTYGTSAIERRTTGDSRDRVLGYSARASSFSESGLRQHFRTIERLLYYYLPKETPAAKKESLTPETAPHRLFFSPALPGLQALGCISYRPTDCAGRVGSYFAHVLIAETAEQDQPWDIIECLQRWNSPGWVKEDNASLPYDLPTLPTLSALCGSTPPAVDERVLWSFLNTPPDCGFDGPQLGPDPGPLACDAHRGPAALFPDGTDGIFGDLRPTARVALVADRAADGRVVLLRHRPSAARGAADAAEFFDLRDGPGSAVDLTGGNDVRRRTLRRRRATGVLSTRVRGQHLARQGFAPPCAPKARYADFVLGNLMDTAEQDAGRLGRLIDSKLARFQEVQVSRASELEELVQANALAKSVLQLTPNLEHRAWQESALRAVYVRRVIRHKLSRPLDEAFLERVLASPEYLPLMLEIGVSNEDPADCSASIMYLTERIQPLERLDELLGASEAARNYKLYALRRHVATSGKLPRDCSWLWTERPSAPRGQPRPLLLFDLLQSSCVTPQVIISSLPGVPEAGLIPLFCGVLRSRLDAAKKSTVLTKIAGRRQFDVVSFLVEAKADVASPAHEKLLKAVFGRWLNHALNRLHGQPARFADTVAALEAAQPLMAGTPGAARVKAWGDLKRMLEGYQRESVGQVSSGSSRAMRQKTWEFADQACECLDRCFPDQDDDCEWLRFDVEQVVSFFRQVAEVYQVQELLPRDFGRYLSAHFRRDEKRKNTVKQAPRRLFLFWGQKG